MSTTTRTTRTSTTRTSTTEPVKPAGSPAAAAAPNPVATAARHLYDTALHAAHQSGVEEWIAAATAKLYQTLVEYLAAIAAVKDSEGPS